MNNAFFVGIGGAGMSKLALLYKSLGYNVSGSDIRLSEYTELLSRKGIKVFIGHSDSHIDNRTDLVVYSSAIREENPEIVKARRLGIPTVKRGKALASVVNNFKNVIISGTHGKTTTASLVGHILKEHGIRTNVYVGGNDSEFNNFYEKPEYFVVESDESDGSFLYLKPDNLIITNIDRDHLNHYGGSFSKLKNAFSDLLKKSNKAVICGEDKNAREIANKYEDKVLFYGSDDFKAENVKYLPNGTEFCIYDKNESLRVFSPLFGYKNVSNVLGALLIAKVIGIPLKRSAEYVESFVPPRRRMEIKKDNEFTLIDDHADHPTEIEATLSAVKKHFPGRRLIAVYQPHRFSRIALLGDKVADPFELSDIVVVTEIFSAFEEPIDGINGKNIARIIENRYPEKEVHFAKDNSDAVRYVNRLLKKGDIVVLLGPGDIGEISGLIGLKGDV